MDKQACAFNSAMTYKVGSVYPVDYTLATFDFTETDVTVRTLITTSRSFSTPTSFTASFINVVDK